MYLYFKYAFKCACKYVCKYTHKHTYKHTCKHTTVIISAHLYAHLNKHMFKCACKSTCEYTREHIRKYLYSGHIMYINIYIQYMDVEKGDMGTHPAPGPLDLGVVTPGLILSSDLPAPSPCRVFPDPHISTTPTPPTPSVLHYPAIITWLSSSGPSVGTLTPPLLPDLTPHHLPAPCCHAHIPLSLFLSFHSGGLLSPPCPGRALQAPLSSSWGVGRVGTSQPILLINVSGLKPLFLLEINFFNLHQ